MLLANTQKQIVQSYAEHFTNGDINKAEKLLEKQTKAIRQQDVFGLSLLGGMAIVLFAVVVFFLAIPYSNPDIDRVRLYSSIPVFEFCFIFIFYICAGGVLI